MYIGPSVYDQNTSINEIKLNIRFIYYHKEMGPFINVYSFYFFQHLNWFKTANINFYLPTIWNTPYKNKVKFLHWSTTIYNDIADIERHQQIN